MYLNCQALPIINDDEYYEFNAYQRNRLFVCLAAWPTLFMVVAIFTHLKASFDYLIRFCFGPLNAPVGPVDDET